MSPRPACGRKASQLPAASLHRAGSRCAHVDPATRSARRECAHDARSRDPHRKRPCKRIWGVHGAKSVVRRSGVHRCPGSPDSNDEKPAVFHTGRTFGHIPCSCQGREVVPQCPRNRVRARCPRRAMRPANPRRRQARADMATVRAGQEARRLKGAARTRRSNAPDKSRTEHGTASLPSDRAWSVQPPQPRRPA